MVRKVRRRSSLFYSQSADDISPTSPNSSGSITQSSSDGHSQRESPPGIPRSDRNMVLPLCSKCRANALSAEDVYAILPSTPEMHSVKSFPNSPEDVRFIRGEYWNPVLDQHQRDHSHAHNRSLGNSPLIRTRRKSSHREPFVGSYEESLLSGRVAAVSCSPPVSFQAKIGVLGRAKYTGHCPPQITTSFDAVFYNWKDDSYSGVGTAAVGSVSPSTTSALEDSPRGSPYVGKIDLNEIYKIRNGPSSKKFPGYHIPRQGQVQIVLSNLQKTAVLFFLIPYDLRKMPPGTKTFIRQKIYEREPKKLIHAIHLQIACPNRNRLYLYGDIRLVFQNREVMASKGHSKLSTTSETFCGEFAKWTKPDVLPETDSEHATTDMDKESLSLCSRCSGVIDEVAEASESTSSEQTAPEHELNIKERPAVTRIASREELDSQMMEDIGASLKFL
ncbi:Uncharacterized protein C3H8.04 [Sugiyamaella lignohabitans]|uniref:Uncharacterized protein C3H8.04 n=1 Tax=Sugiyamaella lignohabitans TaxID=796027 RepID=A0A167DNE2_9ASCO|nr:Uncharacterized protein C3H8.04 [Sugiyamaella lignohabitans]ANB13101.1 Uncharacterized protein C3H8.04 [Sugiyamaella lignohabitans]